MSERFFIDVKSSAFKKKSVSASSVSHAALLKVFLGLLSFTVGLCFLTPNENFSSTENSNLMFKNFFTFPCHTRKIHCLLILYLEEKANGIQIPRQNHHSVS